ncbi:MAG: tyrosine-type recombinase/integrase [Methylovulum sp.]|nr:tyrosine-type recombinase/integrase [Methylovulum sp.]
MLISIEKPKVAGGKLSLLMTWALDAGINKKITFHTVRHTFAVVQLMQGASVYTLQRLMGHTSIATTQKYADIINSERKTAMNAIPSINL